MAAIKKIGGVISTAMSLRLKVIDRQLCSDIVLTYAAVLAGKSCPPAHFLPGLGQNGHARVAELCEVNCVCRLSIFLRNASFSAVSV
jgi:hypothetical protein